MKRDTTIRRRRFAETCGTLLPLPMVDNDSGGKAVLVNGRIEGKAISVSNRYLDIGIIIDLLIFKNDIYEASKGFISEMKK